MPPRREEAGAAAWKLWAVGVLNITGYLLQADTTETLATVDVKELKRLLDEGDVQLVDVREAAERDLELHPGLAEHPLPAAAKRRLARASTPTRPVVTICEAGPRAAIAASLLQGKGFDARPVVEGGIPDFDGETVSFRRCGS